MVALLLLMATFSGIHAQTSAAAATALVAKESEHDFGKVVQGKPVYYSFTLVNKSSQPIKLEEVTATCGCTTPEWTKAPVAPGGSTQVKVGFNAAAEGPFEKWITVKYSGAQKAQLKIKGSVWTPPAGAAPPNAAVQFLKQQSQ